MRRHLIAAIAAIAFAPAAALAQTCPAPIPAAELVKPGTLVMSTNPTLPPLQFVNAQGQLQGMRIELGNEIAKRLCLTPEYVRIEFSAMIPGLAARRWDMINTGIFFTEERARMMQMIRYENNAVAISAARGNPLNIRSQDDLAGKTIGVELGGFEERTLRGISQQLVAAGKPAINIRTFDNFAVAFQALRAGQVQGVTSIDAVAAEYDQRGDFPRVLHGLNPAPAALAFRSRPLAEQVSWALQQMLADGSLDALFNKYGVGIADRSFAIVGPQ
ncbi:ABC transporter substrate-binding protein [Roseomonas sp. AR75]|jgi:polar amino acid transport system substrate-binding protein|uniref:ABC transporter substrate-binding protein n=1 Tax=Roseomonas sp. AR75 TaxID=2562311 RepID=UPI0010BF6E8A|nr:ABC transporter substrate-binding protein [Roseomonas sp. AR75]